MVVWRRPVPAPRPAWARPRPQGSRPTARCIPARPAAPRASAGCGPPPAHTPHTGCPQSPRRLAVLWEHECGAHPSGGGKSGPPGWALWSPGRLPPASGGSVLASHVARLHTPVGLCLRLGTCTSRLLAFLVGRGLGDTATTPAASPWPGLGTAASGAGTGIWTVASSHEVVGGPTPALPWGGRPGLTVF